ncbi:hypothetical protein O6H91_16G031200 [Diphasiastrum complanatum]|uniref:Uncharacterized protein n=1 Tax=Diphasiastrum complanatum TaxID=34168 RepID=A0ACC2BB54_DIPCM|nr:hypothetical protein O6H91_16G031200 [Diphasiastrum complanatum]
MGFLKCNIYPISPIISHVCLCIGVSVSGATCCLAASCLAPRMCACSAPSALPGTWPGTNIACLVPLACLWLPGATCAARDRGTLLHVKDLSVAFLTGTSIACLVPLACGYPGRGPAPVLPAWCHLPVATRGHLRCPRSRHAVACERFERRIFYGHRARPTGAKKYFEQSKPRVAEAHERALLPSHANKLLHFPLALGPLQIDLGEPRLFLAGTIWIMRGGVP